MMLLATLSATAAFVTCANNMAAQAASPPAIVRYHELTHVTSKTLRVDRSKGLTLYRRATDGLIWYAFDDGDGKLATQTRPYMFSPTFDALSDFQMHGDARGDGSFRLWIDNVVPLTYKVTNPGADLVVIALRRYTAQLVPSDDPNTLHVHLDTTSDDTNILPRLYFKDVYVDAGTMLAKRVELVGPDERQFSIDYSIVDGHPVVKSFTFGQTYSRLGGLVRVRMTLEGTYSDISFPPAAPPE